MVNREMAAVLKGMHRYFPVVSLTGPRQSGKTTLIRSVFKDLPYFNMEDAEQRDFILHDPKAFLSRNASGAVIDEAQRTPELFSYLQVHVDEYKNSRFVLSGSQNFLLSESISQSLAGRVGMADLLPFSIDELRSASLLPKSLDEILYKGLYPGIYDRDIPPELFYSSYLKTYVERDVRLIKNIDNIEVFDRFIRLCAGRAGHLVNLSSLASDTGISLNTAKSWISLLEASYLIYILRPYHANLNKRLIKSPKLYFTDTGLLCHLLGIGSPGQLHTHYMRGNIFENHVILQILKMHYNKLKTPRLWFWQDSNRNEVDLLIEAKGELIPVEVKSGQTFTPEFFKNIRVLQKIEKLNIGKGFIIYAGERSSDHEAEALLRAEDFDAELSLVLFPEAEEK